MQGACLTAGRPAGPEVLPGGPRLEDAHPLDAPGHHVVQGSRRVQACLARHGRERKAREVLCQVASAPTYPLRTRRRRARPRRGHRRASPASLARIGPVGRLSAACLCVSACRQVPGPGRRPPATTPNIDTTMGREEFRATLSEKRANTNDARRSGIERGLSLADEETAGCPFAVPLPRSSGARTFQALARAVPVGLTRTWA